MSLILIANNLVPELEREDGTADYDVEVSINRRAYIWCGKIEGHVRDEGAIKLLKLVIEAMEAHPKHRGDM